MAAADARGVAVTKRATIMIRLIRDRRLGIVVAFMLPMLSWCSSMARLALSQELWWPAYGSQICGEIFYDLYVVVFPLS